MNRLRKKLKSKKGESLAEVMVAILISVVGMLLMSSLIMTATNIVNKGDKQIKTLYNGVTVMEEQATPTAKGKQLIIEHNGRSKTRSLAYVDIYEDSSSKLISYRKTVK